jgi:hypothetical protein
VIPTIDSSARSASSTDAWLPGLIGLLGERAVVLHAPSDADSGGDGRDLDCAVAELDRLWPLRLGRGWRLCQCLHYDLRGWSWMLDRQGEMLHLDTISDARGLGRDGFPSRLVPDGAFELPAAVRAAYLSAKRLRKGDRSARAWARIGQLAADDPAEATGALRVVLGPRLTALVGPFALQGQAPDPASWRRARWLRLGRRVRTPARALTMLTLGAGRWLERAVRPTGLVVLVAGPDGTGKSTLADALPGRCRGMFRRTVRQHWRPGLLPRPGMFLGRRQPDPASPHARPPHGRAASLALLGYFWFDFLLGAWLRLWPARLRTGLAVVERGWWDVAVDPRRYRLQAPERLTLLLGRLLPRPDLVLVLRAPPEAVLARKAELPGTELVRQTGAWERVLPPGTRRVQLDATRPPELLGGDAREAVARTLEERAVARLGPGWAGLPSRRAGRWLLPRGPRAAAVAATAIYHPITPRARAGWEALRLLAAVGAYRLLPRGQAPPREVREALAPYLPRGGSLVVARSSHPGRYLALLIDRQGRHHGLAKVAATPEAAPALEREARWIGSLAPLLPPPLAAPSVVAHEPGLLLLEAVAWRPRRHPWQLDDQVAHALGSFFRAGAQRQDGRHPRGPSHGDFAPWNMLRTGNGWTLVDWEAADLASPPFFDLFHYLVQGHALLANPSRRALLAGVEAGRGWIGRSIRAYADGAGVAATAAPGLFQDYLVASPDMLLPRTTTERDGRAARRRLLQELGR